MNKKILFIATLILFAIVSIGSLSAADDVIDESVSADADDSIAIDEEVVSANDDAALGDGETIINIAADENEEQIQAKLNNLQSNTIVNFAEGATYTANNLSVRGDSEGNRLSNIQFIGNGATITGTPAKGAPGTMAYYTGIFELNKIDGFTITGFNFVALNAKMANPNTPSCVVVSNCTNGLIENNTFDGGRFGLYVGNKKNDFGPAPTVGITIKNNTVTNVGDMGIISFGATKTQILNNTIINPANHGIDVRFPAGGFTNVTVKGNTIYGAKEGIYIMHSAGHTVTENVINASVIGITCYGSNDVNCLNNVFVENTKIGYFLGNGYANITIAETADSFAGLFQTKMPPTFPYYIVKSDAAYTQELAGIFSDLADTGMTYIEALFANEDDVLVDLRPGTINVISDALIPKNQFLTIKVWKYDDRNHIDAGETIRITLDKEIINLTSDTGGAVFLDISKLAKGQHTMTVFYPGNADLAPSTWTGVIQLGSIDVPVSTQEITNIEASAITTTAKVAKDLVLTLKDSKGVLANKAVTVSVNGETSTVTTDAKGQATVKVNFAKSGTYYYSLCFLGDDDYKASFQTVKVTVNKQATKATFAKKTFKVKKAKKLSFTLKDASGKAISGKKITFKVNKKTYTAKTNAKGVATVKVKITKKGKYTATAKFAGDDTYKAVSKKAKITVKK